MTLIRFLKFFSLHFCLADEQSRVGPVQWLKPYTDEVLVELGKKGVKSLLAVPVRYFTLSCRNSAMSKSVIELCSM